MAERKTIQDRIRESDLSAFSSIGSPLPGTGVRYDMDNQSTLTPAQTAYLASVFAPGAGITDATVGFPEFPGPDIALVDAFSGDPMPSMAENIAAGGIDRYLFAPLQGLGVLGDAAYGIPIAGPVIAGALKAPSALATLAGGIAKASKGSKAVDKGLGSLDQPKDMMFVHNTSEEAIKSFDAMGGIPSPSLAVQPTDIPLKGFGEIQLIGKPKNFDPSVDPRNAVYSADAYTPRAPKKIRLANRDAVVRLENDYYKLAEENGYEEVLEKGQDALRGLQKNSLYYPENRMDELDRFFDTPLAKEKFAKEKGHSEQEFDGDNFTAFGLNADFNKWAAKQKDKYLSQEGVFQYFDDFEQTTVTKPYTLENATENMIKETQRGGESASTAFGPASIRALMTRRFDDLADIKSERSRIGNTTSSEGLGREVQLLLDSYDFPEPTATKILGTNMLNDIGIALSDGKKLDEDLLKNAYNQNIDFDDVEKYTSTGGFEYDNPPKGFLDDLEKIFVDNATKNVNYFEAKPMRAVGFDEFAGAIVPPKTSKEVIDILENRGLKVIKNDPETDFMKTKARQKFEDQMFSFAPIVGAGGIAALSIDDNTPDNDKGVGSLN